MNETNYWICDKCGRKIENVGEGWVEWLTPTADNFPEKNNFGIRIVHSTDCLYTDRECGNHKAIPGDASLEDFTGADGLMDLLRFISDDEFKDKEDVLETIKRIHIPGYEEARKHIYEAIDEGVYEPNTKVNYCSQRDIENILDYVARN